MKDGVRAGGEQVEVSRQELYEDYVTWYLQPYTEVRPCQDAGLLNKAARYLLREPEPEGTFTLFPLYQALREGYEARSSDCRRLLSAFIKAAELLETLCVNLFLQPWRKEIKTLKTFTGPFVYCLLPVLSSSTIQSVLASIGYLPHTDTPQREYRLSEDANPDGAMLVGFELLLARVECNHLLKLLDKDQLGPQEWLEVLQRREGPAKLEAPIEKKTTTGQKKEEGEKKKEKADGEEVPPYLDTKLVNPLPKPRRSQLISVDHSIMEMQKTYPDLAFRGRPLLPEKPHRTSSRSSSSRAVHTDSTNNDREDSKLTHLPRSCDKYSKAAATVICSRNDDSKAAEVFSEDVGSSVLEDWSRGPNIVTPGDATSSSFTNTDGGRVDELSHPPTVSLHLTLRAGPTAEQRLKPGEPQQQTAADLQEKTPASPGPPSVSSMDEEQDLRELAERMGQLKMQDTKEEFRRKEENKRVEMTNKERRKKERKASAENEAEEQNLRRPAKDTGPAMSHASCRRTRSSQSDPAAVKEQKQHTECHPSSLAVSTADCQSCRGGSTGQHEGEETGRGEEEQLAQGYVLL